MKKLLLLLLSTLCLSIVGCSADSKESDKKAEAKGEIKEEKKKDDTYKETVVLKDGEIINNGLFFFPNWEHAENKFTHKIISISLNNSEELGKQKATVTINNNSINQGDKDVYHSLKRLEMVDDQGHKAKIMPVDIPGHHISMVDVIEAGKKNDGMFFCTFDEVGDYNSIKSITLKYPIYFGADDDAYQTVKRNEITFKLK
ncbi:hypothetical protein V7183_23950 [Bacillus sp. JJ1127]|uniref:hypothetical protein n=1 Tax=Bacillus sp. JJ1127 TaxID=3122952 RepID=UPI003000074F